MLEWLRQNDNPVGKLLGQKMVDKIALFLVPCSHALELFW
jgi:hypothetical protein